jgi:hypothetical protein
VHRVISVLDFDVDPAHDLDDWDTELSTDWTSRRQTAAKNNLVTPTSVSADGLTTGLILVAEQSANSVLGKRELVTVLDQIVAREFGRSQMGPAFCLVAGA